ncbi:MAG: hypothetical protein RIQ54_277 [Candidatus Parcubacteria bacterium]|jgi:hypothetical protein
MGNGGGVILTDMQHYYGDTVRRLFIAAAVIMTVTLPFFAEEIGMAASGISIIGIILTGLAAGLTNPKSITSAVINGIVSGVAVLVFELYSIDTYTRLQTMSIFLLINQLLAALYIIALYYSIKTIRGIVVNNHERGAAQRD